MTLPVGQRGVLSFSPCLVGSWPACWMIDPQQAGRLAYRSALRSLHSRITGSAGVACPMDRPLSKGTGALQREKKGVELLNSRPASLLSVIPFREIPRRFNLSHLCSFSHFLFFLWLLDRPSLVSVTLLLLPRDNVQLPTTMDSRGLSAHYHRPPILRLPNTSDYRYSVLPRELKTSTSART